MGTGPMAAVIGQASSDGPGMELVQARFQPSGANTRFVSSGWSPCSIACGHQASDQVKLAWSDPYEPTTEPPPSRSTPRPNSATESSA